MRLVVIFFFVPGMLLATNWPGWRGPSSDGTSPEKGIPLKWSSTENIAWKAAIPGKGHSSPVVWGDRVFLTSCLPEKEQRILLCLDRHTGKIIWTKVVLNSPLETIHPLNSRASGTPATDGQHVFVAFMMADDRKILAPNVGTPRMITPGKIISAAYDMEGKQKWKITVGDFVSAHGFNTCPVLFEELVTSMVITMATPTLSRLIAKQERSVGAPGEKTKPAATSRRLFVRSTGALK